MNPYLLIEVGSSVHAVAPLTKTIVRQIEGNEDAATHPWLVEGKYYTLERIIELFTPDDIRPSSTVERECPRCEGEGQLEYAGIQPSERTHPIDDRHGRCPNFCDDGTQSYTIPKDSLELIKLSTFVNSVVHSHEEQRDLCDEICIDLDAIGPNFPADPYILVSRDLKRGVTQ